MPTRTRALMTLVASSTLLSAGALLLSGYAGGPVTDGGTLSGSVRMTGNTPRLRAHKATKTPAVCGPTVPNEEIVTGRGGALANAVVWIDGIEQGKPAGRHDITLDQQRCRYVPHVQATTRRSQLTITSSDATLHNTHGFLGKRTVFNLALPAKGMRINRRLNRAGRIDLKCDAGHTWMGASIHVFDHPYFAVTGDDGAFSMSDVPPGTHTLTVWHERLGTQTAQVTVAAGATATHRFSLPAR